MSELALVVDSQLYGGWTDIDVRLGVERVAGSFELKVVELWPDAQQVRDIPVGARCEIRIGDETVISGWVDEVEPEYDAESHKVAVRGRDSLTGLFNHTHTLYLLEQEIVRARQKDQPLCFAMIDLDYFKKVNDTFGHPIGDRILRSLSMFLKQRLRKTDHIGRYGGEEFALILPNTRPGDARNVVNEIRERFSELLQEAGDRQFKVTFSCGLAAWQGESSQSLCERADRALYVSKAHGRNCVTLAEE